MTSIVVTTCITGANPTVTFSREDTSAGFPSAACSVLFAAACAVAFGNWMATSRSTLAGFTEMSTKRVATCARVASTPPMVEIRTSG